MKNRVCLLIVSLTPLTMLTPLFAAEAKSAAEALQEGRACFTTGAISMGQSPPTGIFHDFH